MIDAPTLWTLDELAGRVDAALSVGYDGQASGRVRDVPDPRAIRYYTTLGLVDRPIARHGSTVLYGPRHLLQLVAIKKLQARGLPLARIQVELAGATDQQLQRVATLQGVRLADGVTLLLDQARPLREGEGRAIQAAAEHLLQALRARGLGGP